MPVKWLLYACLQELRIINAECGVRLRKFLFEKAQIIFEWLTEVTTCSSRTTVQTQTV
jgi:hypothetical protein